MNKLNKYTAFERFQAVLWDFDGVLMNSNEIRDFGFMEVLKDFPKEQVSQLLDYHRANGGLSRYHKFRYFYEVILGQQITENMVMELASSFSVIMHKKLLDSSLLIRETTSFVERNFEGVPMYIVSGSDQNELRALCEAHQLKNFFKGIFGSPTPKKELVKDILIKNNFSASDCILIGDSVNDFEAAEVNGLFFMAYNNKAIEGLSTALIDLSA
jgi:phosphoglycolate phosphatase-like HAD superfamily hydrolase